MISKSNKKVYLDFASATPLCKEVEKAMDSVSDFFANPDSIYASGVETKKIVENARKSVAGILSARSDEIIFTSGGTEGNNLVIFGLYNFLINENSNRKLHIVTSTIEHSSVLESIRELENKGVKVTYVKPNNEGIIDPKDIRDALRPETFLVSIMYVNNEIGTIQPIREISKIIRNFRKALSPKLQALSSVFFHTDACQAPNYLDLSVQALGVDFLTLDGGKIYGPKGVGIIFSKRSISLKPIFFGGSQERGVRSGTLSTSLVVGFAKALEVAVLLSEKESKRLLKLREYFLNEIINKLPKVMGQPRINGSLIERVPNNINICFEKLDAEFAVLALDAYGVECSSASTCMNIKNESYSYVVKELGEKDCSMSSLRFSFGRSTTKKDLDYCLKALGHILLNQWNTSQNNK